MKFLLDKEKKLLNNTNVEPKIKKGDESQKGNYKRNCTKAISDFGTISKIVGVHLVMLLDHSLPIQK